MSVGPSGLGSFRSLSALEYLWLNLLNDVIGTSGKPVQLLGGTYCSVATRSKVHKKAQNSYFPTRFMFTDWK